MKKLLKFFKSKTGFTLVELVIVIAIVIILSVISVPIYRGYVDKAKWSEGYALLGTILSAQKAYYSEYGNFYAEEGTKRLWTTYHPVLNVDIRGNKYFTLFAIGNPDNKIECSAFATKPLDLFKENANTYFVLFYNMNSGVSFYQWS